MNKLVGIDFGSRFGGTTVIAWMDDDGRIHYRQSAKKEDADAFLSEQLDLLRPELIAIDAPLSLPIGYFREEGDLNYRKADRELKAMSPMFLGGLTARAIRLQRSQAKLGRDVIEVYPGGLVRHWGLEYYQKKGIPSQELRAELEAREITFAEWPTSMHQVDAGLALWSGIRYLDSKALKYGEAIEGLIII